MLLAELQLDPRVHVIWIIRFNARPAIAPPTRACTLPPHTGSQGSNPRHYLFFFFLPAIGVPRSLLKIRRLAFVFLASTRPGQTSGRVGFGSGQGRVTGRIGRPAPDPYLSPGRVGLARAPCAGVSGRVFFGLGRVFWPLGRVFRVGSGFGSKITARARPVDCCGSKNTARAHPPRSSGRVGSGFFRAGWVGLFGSGDPCPGLIQTDMEAPSSTFRDKCN